MNSTEAISVELVEGEVLGRRRIAVPIGGDILVDVPAEEVRRLRRVVDVLFEVPLGEGLLPAFDGVDESNE